MSQKFWDTLYFINLDHHIRTFLLLQKLLHILWRLAFPWLRHKKYIKGLTICLHSSPKKLRYTSIWIHPGSYLGINQFISSHISSSHFISIGLQENACNSSNVQALIHPSDTWPHQPCRDYLRQFAGPNLTTSKSDRWGCMAGRPACSNNKTVIYVLWWSGSFSSRWEEKQTRGRIFLFYYLIGV